MSHRRHSENLMKSYQSKRHLSICTRTPVVKLYPLIPAHRLKSMGRGSISVVTQRWNRHLDKPNAPIRADFGSVGSQIRLRIDFVDRSDNLDKVFFLLSLDLCDGRKRKFPGVVRAGGFSRAPILTRAMKNKDDSYLLNKEGRAFNSPGSQS